MTIELTVILKDSERTYKQKSLLYEPISLRHDDRMINECIKEAQMNFQGEPEDIVINAKMVFK